MKTMACILSCVLAFCVSSCNHVTNGVVIYDKGQTMSSAEARLCGRHKPLTKNGAEIRGAIPITCEGDGAILVRLLNGKETTCRIGYVTPGARQDFRFVVEGGQCR